MKVSTSIAVATVLLLLRFTPDSFSAETDSGAWFTVLHSEELTESLGAQFLFQTRIDEEFSAVDRYVLRPSISYQTTELGIWTIGYDSHLLQEPVSAAEHRAWQQFSTSWSAARFEISLRCRLEERWIENVDSVAFRPRFRVGVKYPIPESLCYLKLS